MNGHGSAREVLVVEALGDVAKLLDRVDGLRDLIRALDLAREDVERAGTQLQTQAAAMEERMAKMTEHAKTETAKYIAHHVEQHARRLMQTQSRDMHAGARAMFEEELKSALQRLGHFIETRSAHRSLRFEWWISVVTGASLIMLTHALTIYFVGR